MANTVFYIIGNGRSLKVYFRTFAKNIGNIKASMFAIQSYIRTLSFILLISL